jgi:hypothetical protein
VPDIASHLHRAGRCRGSSVVNQTYQWEALLLSQGTLLESLISNAQIALMDVSRSVRYLDLVDSKENKQPGRVGCGSVGNPSKLLILWYLAERVGFEFTRKRSFNNIERTAGTVKAMEDRGSSANGSQTDHGSVSPQKGSWAGTLLFYPVTRRGRSNLHAGVGVRVPASQWLTLPQLMDKPGCRYRSGATYGMPVI